MSSRYDQGVMRCCLPKFSRTKSCDKIAPVKKRMTFSVIQLT